MKIKIGTRASKLALTQTNMVAEAIKKIEPLADIQIIHISTLGDKKQGKPESSFGDKKDWVYELELAILNNQIDFAVHSAKDVPGNIESGTDTLPILERADPTDVFIDAKNSDGTRKKFSELTDGDTVGTASLRRQAALFFYNKNLKVIEHRGNIQTRLDKLDSSETLSGIILAKAGLDRLDLTDFINAESIDTRIMLPAMNQGILCAQFRKDDTKIKDLLASLSDETLKLIYLSERKIAEKLEGDCKSAISIYTEISDNTLLLKTKIMSIQQNTYLEKQYYLNKQLPNFNSDLDNAIDDLISCGARELV